jgi:hypothetical protein
MWKFLGQKSFPMSERQYMEQLDAVAELVTEWGCADQVRERAVRCFVPRCFVPPISL